jgi:hypothetical protein
MADGRLDQEQDFGHLRSNIRALTECHGGIRAARPLFDPDQKEFPVSPARFPGRRKTDMKRHPLTRNLVRSASLLLAAFGAAVLLAGCLEPADPGTGPIDQPAVTRKSASAMSEVEIDRFRRAFEYAVAKGRFDDFNLAHCDHHHARQHGVEVLMTSPMTVVINPTTWGYRLLPWHRAFILEAEAMLRAALRERNREEGRDTSEADKLFMPYWDAAHDQELPAWVMNFHPKGGTALARPGLPPGHAGHGKAVGESYNIAFGRWPGNHPIWNSLQTPDYVLRILARGTFVDFYQALDLNPEIIFPNYPKALAALRTLEVMLPGDPAPAKMLEVLAPQPEDGAAVLDTATINALFSLSHTAAVEDRKAEPRHPLIAAVKDVYSLFNFTPHVRMHVWAGGLDPADAGVRGTVTYFHELAVDPVFWMLHCELDRYWYSWETKHDGKPPLTGDDTIFAPMTSSQGKWYGGGRTYSLDQLTNHVGLGYAYDAPF